MSSIEDLAVDVANAAIAARIEDGKLLWDVSVETGPKKIESLTWKPTPRSTIISHPSARSGTSWRMAGAT